MRVFLVTLFLLAFAVACVDPPNYPDEPEIEFLFLNKNVIVQGTPNAPNDTLAITFGFTDGDGDIGTEGDSLDVFLTDSRDGFVNRFKLPVIPEQGIGNGISGEITLKIPNKPFNICCTFPDGTACRANTQYPQDTFSYLIQIRDRADRFSNMVRTGVITILCD